MRWRGGLVGAELAVVIAVEDVELVGRAVEFGAGDPTVAIAVEVLDEFVAVAPAAPGVGAVVVRGLRRAWFFCG